MQIVDPLLTAYMCKQYHGYNIAVQNSLTRVRLSSSSRVALKFHVATCRLRLLQRTQHCLYTIQFSQLTSFTCTVWILRHSFISSFVLSPEPVYSKYWQANTVTYAVRHPCVSFGMLRSKLYINTVGGAGAAHAYAYISCVQYVYRCSMIHSSIHNLYGIVPMTDYISMYACIHVWLTVNVKRYTHVHCQ